MPQPPRSRTALALLGAAAVAAVIIAVVLITGGGGRSGTPAQAAVTRVGPESIFEAEPQLHADPAGTLDILRGLGVDRVRVYMAWSAVAPEPGSRTAPAGFRGTDPAAYPAAGWAIYDTIVRDALQRGIGIDLTLGAPAPLWATGRHGPRRGFRLAWKPSAAAFGAFVRAVAVRYGGSYAPAGGAKPLPRVSFWSIWNEPNYGPDLAPQATHHSTVETSPALYRALVDRAWRALRLTGHGHDTILIGELAPRGITVGNSPGNFGGMVPLRFVRALYCVDASYRELRGAAALARGCPPTAGGSARFAQAHPALFHASGFSDHPYPQGLPPNVATIGEPDYADLPQLPKLEALLDALQRVYGSSTRFPIYSTEFGYKTNPPAAFAGAVSPAQAAEYMNWAEYITWRDRRISSYDQYLLADPTVGNFATGLEFANGSPKPGFAAYRMPIFLPVTAASAGSALDVWGCVRPAHFARLDTGTAARVEIQFQRAGDSAFRTLRTLTVHDTYGYFDVRLAFPASGAVRTRWMYPHGPAVFSRTVAVAIR